MTNESFIKVNNKLVLVNGHPITINGSSSNLQENKAVTITSNGTSTITPDEGYDGLSSVDVTVNVASGGGGGAGFKVTFPATATNWNAAVLFELLLPDGTTINGTDYSSIASQTFDNVVAIRCIGVGGWLVLKLTLSVGTVVYGKITLQDNPYWLTTAPNTTKTPTRAGDCMIWIPVTDITISKIEMYDTD